MVYLFINFLYESDISIFIISFVYRVFLFVLIK